MCFMVGRNPPLTQAFMILIPIKIYLAKPTSKATNRKPWSQEIPGSCHAVSYFLVTFGFSVVSSVMLRCVPAFGQLLNHVPGVGGWQAALAYAAEQK